MRVIVTGAASFIGSAVVRRLLNQGDFVCAIVRPASRNLPGLMRKITEPEQDRIEIVEMDLHQIDHLPERIPAVCWDGWIHVGWDGAGSENRTRKDVQQLNVTQTLLAIRTAEKLGCRRFVFTGSQAEYGIWHVPVTEETPCHPVSEYGKAKAAVAAAAGKLCQSLNIEYVHTRIYSVYGPGDHPWTLVNSCLRTWQEGKTMRLGACTQQWNFLYIEDAAAALCCLLTEGKPGFYNVAGADTRCLRSFIEEMYRLCGKRGDYEYGERAQNAEGAADLIPDISRILADTGWRPRVSFEEGIRRMLAEEGAE
ncbi:MAG: NAD(P)-dependent oxidoreductase [Clostridiales bacterium]|nr:NAD(P)-dependent oxidoreductase [Clostridiales bacterium]